MIKKPFAYMGCKGRFWKEIKAVFDENRRENFIDLFGGAMEIPLNLKNTYSDLRVLVNVKDSNLENFLKCKNVLELRERALKYITQGEQIENSRLIYQSDKEKFEKYKRRFKSIFVAICECCGQPLKKASKSPFTEEEKEILKLMFGFDGKGTSLASAFYSVDKTEKFKEYIKALETVKIQTELFDENWQFENSFIFLDPPYIQKIATDEQGFVGYDYVTNAGVKWTTQDDERVVNFIKNNTGKNNVFLIFGSVENNLAKLLRNNFECDFKIKEYKRSSFGKVVNKAEYFCLIKGGDKMG